MVEKERFRQQMEFCLELDKEKQIGRQTYLSDGSRKENDAEHAWHMAIMALILGEYANENIDLLKTVAMLLMHDVVEIDAGDTYAYDEEGKKTQRQREERAADRLYGLLPADQQKKYRDLWEEFEANETPEAHFAHTLDNVQPAMLNVAAKGKSWEEHKTKLSSILERNACTPWGSEVLWEHSKENYLRPYVENGMIEGDVELK